jgi:hypothetical protein
MAAYMQNEEPNKQFYVGNLIAEVHMLCQMFGYSQTFLYNSPSLAVDFLVRDYVLVATRL